MDNALFVGDNVELPVPFCTESTDIQAYRNTLLAYQKLNPKYLIPGHGPLASRGDLAANLAYLLEQV